MAKMLIGLRLPKMALINATAIFSVVGSDVQALTLDSRPWPLRHLHSSTRNIAIHPLDGAPRAAASGFSLFRSGALSLPQAAQRLLRDQSLNPLVELRADNEVLNLADGWQADGTQSVSFGFFVSGIPFCEHFQARAHSVRGQMFMLATVPDISSNAWGLSSDEFLAATGDEGIAVAAARAEHSGLGLKVTSATVTHRRKCVAIRQGQLFPEIDYRVLISGLPYQVRISQSRVSAVTRGYFDLTTGVANAYEYHSLAGSPREVQLSDLTGDGTLTTQYLRVIVPTSYASVVTSQTGTTYKSVPVNGSTTSWSAVHKSDQDFRFSSSHGSFAEAQAFVHVQDHYTFAKSLGFEWYGPSPLQVRLHVKPGGRSNNALYVPGSLSDNSPPTISVDDGDGIDLQNLAIDSDVVSHEFGHHIIYKTLQATEGESLVLHEGLADFFAFSRSGDSCLGESICPAGSRACVIQNQCLRSAEIPVVYKDDTWNQWGNGRLGHLHGQLISGLLWDMRKSGAIPTAELAPLVHKAVSFFKSDSGFRDFVLSLLLADCALHEGKYHSAISAAGDARGLGEFFTDVSASCDAIPLPVGGGLQSPDTSESNGKKSSSRSSTSPFSCGVIANHTAVVDQIAMLVILIAALSWPLTAIFIKPVQAKVRSLRSKRPRRH